MCKLGRITGVLWVLLAAATARGAAADTRPAGGPATAAASGTATSRPAKLGPGNQIRTVRVDGKDRTYLVHVPPTYDPHKPTPVVVILHGAWANGAVQAAFSGMNPKADSAGFLAVYPNGWGIGSAMLFFNAWAPPGANGQPPDDVKFVATLLDDLAGAANVDPRRVYATGMSNGGMMCYRLAAELSDRIAAIAAVSGTQCIPKASPARPVPVLHFHGTADTIVPLSGPPPRTPKFLTYKPVDETMRIWAKLDGCPEEPKVTDLPDTAHDGTTVVKKVYGPGKDGSEVVLYLIHGAGHTWPGKNPVVQFLGKSTKNISANDLIWEFFQNHPMPAAATGSR
jgi:polyhydroxybutyrate depolymerase